MEHQELADLSKIKIDSTYNKEEKMEEFLSQIHDPYHFMVGSVEVTISFAADAEPLQKVLERNFEQMVLMG